MKILIDIDEGVSEDEIIFHCKEISDEILVLQRLISDNMNQSKYLALKKDEKEYFIETQKILFFETDSRIVYAHTKDSLYQAEYKLYELEMLLPSSFIRVSKSAIVNIDEILSIAKNITSSSVVEFSGTKKQVFVSRQYYRLLLDRVSERKLHKRKVSG